MTRPRPSDRWTTRARPTFLYVIYIIILWTIPMSMVAAVSPALARQMTTGIAAYLAAIPDALWTLFGTGYLGYTAARSWGKARGSEK